MSTDADDLDNEPPFTREDFDDALAELISLGLIRDTGKRIDGKIVWEANPNARPSWEPLQ